MTVDGGASLRLRAIYAALALVVIAAGLAWRWPGLSLPPPVAKYGGSVLWGTMVFLVLRTILPDRPVAAVALLAAMLAAAVEFSQLLHWPWLDAVRRTRIGLLLLGRVFSGWDILSYWIGIAAAAAADAMIRRACVR